MSAILSAVCGLACGLMLGVAYAFLMSSRTNPYGKWLEKECWVRPTHREEWRKHVIVAVSWQGAVCVRDCERLDEDGYWVKKQNVPWRVRFDEPKEGE